MKWLDYQNPICGLHPMFSRLCQQNGASDENTQSTQQYDTIYGCFDHTHSSHTNGVKLTVQVNCSSKYMMGNHFTRRNNSSIKLQISNRKKENC